MDNFYYDLLNIRKVNNKIDYFNIIEKVIKEEAEVFRKDNPNLDGLCIFVSTNISDALKNNNINSKIINTNDLYEGYKHQFVISSYIDEDTVKYILIDPTFTQFRYNNEIELEYDLATKGYSEIDDEKLKKYISLVMQKDISNIDISIEDIMLERRHK